MRSSRISNRWASSCATWRTASSRFRRSGTVSRRGSARRLADAESAFLAHHPRGIRQPQAALADALCGGRRLPPGHHGCTGSADASGRRCPRANRARSGRPGRQRGGAVGALWRDRPPRRPVASDAAGTLLREALRGDAVELVELPAERSGAVVALIENGERTMLSHRAAFSRSVADELAVAVADAGWIHRSGYALLDPRGPEVAATLARRPVEPCSAWAGAQFRWRQQRNSETFSPLPDRTCWSSTTPRRHPLGPGFSTVVTDRHGIERERSGR